jgi:hypothetical protein
MAGSTGVEVTGDGEKVTVFDLGQRSGLNPKETARYGMASIHVDVSDVKVTEQGAAIAPPIPNGMLLIDVTASTDGNGERFTIDATRGAILAVGGCDAIHLAAYFVPAVQGEALVPYATKRVTCTVHWPTSIGPKSSHLSLPSVVIPAAIAPAVVGITPWIKIPRQARRFYALSPTPAALATTTAEFANDERAGAVVRYATLNPVFANQTPIVHGAEFVRFVGTPASIMIPFFLLWP